MDTSVVFGPRAGEQHRRAKFPRGVRNSGRILGLLAAFCALLAMTFAAGIGAAEPILAPAQPIGVLSADRMPANSPPALLDSPATTTPQPPGYNGCTTSDCTGTHDGNPQAEYCPDGSVKPRSGKCAPAVEYCPDGSVKPSSGTCPKQVEYCPDGSVKPASGKCAPVIDYCPDGSVKPSSGTCPKPIEYCPDGSVKPASGKCAPVIDYCPDGSVKPSSGTCPKPIEYCPDGSRKPDSGVCPTTQPEKCPDGSVKPANGVCPTTAPPEKCPDGSVKPAGGVCPTTAPPEKCPDGSVKPANGVCPTTAPPEKCPDGSVKPASGKCETSGGNPNPGGGNPNPVGGNPNPVITTPPPTANPPANPGGNAVPQPDPTTQPPNPEPPKPTGPTTAAANAGLSLNPVAVPPGAQVTVTGRGCDANANVKLSIGGASAGDTRARADGGFDATLPTGTTEVGQHQVTAECGPKLAADLDVVLVSQVGGDAGTATVLLFFLLIGGWFFGHRLVSHLPARRPR